MYDDNYKLSELNFEDPSYPEGDYLRDIESLRFNTPQERTDFAYNGGVHDYETNE